MSKVLTKLRIDEVSCVDKGAGEGTRVVLWKRDGGERDGFYQRLFSKRTVRRSRRLRANHELRDIADAKHALLHSPDGRALLRETAEDIDTLAAHLLEASEAARVRNAAASNKREASTMDTARSFTKAIAEMGEHDYTAIIQKYASNNRLPNETPAMAFTRIFTENSEQGQAIRRFRKIARDGGIASGALDEPSDTDDESEGDALAELNELA